MMRPPNAGALFRARMEELVTKAKAALEKGAAS